MNDCERELVRNVCEGDIKKAQQTVRTILNGMTAKKDQSFQQTMLRKLDMKLVNLIDLPYNLKELLVAEDTTNFPMGKFILREGEEAIVKKILRVLKASNKLGEMGIEYLPALMLYGESGGGKTMLARYIAHRAGLPFVYMRFSSIVSSYLGSTQANIAKVFEYAKSAPCVLCFDEIDAVGMARGQKNDVGEMNRIVIALMQEMDRLPNNIIIVGTTNRFDRLDPALVRRFPIQYEVLPLDSENTLMLARKFFRYCGSGEPEGGAKAWCSSNFGEKEMASAVVNKCTDFIIGKVMEKFNEE